ncbi:MAG: sodium-independent anion transporter [Actinobacteria bacterium]|nr:sodium-independent anion transporter [Actinomycetota bacterium]
MEVFARAFGAATFDIPAGIIVAVVALPLALGFGVTSGAGAVSGIVTAIVAGLVAGLLGGSKYQVSGPTGAMVVVLFPIIAQVGMSGLLVVGVLAGALIVLFGLLKFGKYVEKIPWAVMEGFTLGIALVIALQQLPLIFEVPRAAGTETLTVALGTLHNVGLSSLHLWPIGLVVATLAIKVGWSSMRTRWASLSVIPPSAVAVVLLSLIAWAISAPVMTVGVLPSGSLFRFNPAWPELPLGALIYAAVVVALLGTVESLLSARVADAMVKRRDGLIVDSYRPNRELVGQGLATIASSMIGGMPATGAIARTAVNVNAGAKTRLATVVHSLVLLAFVFAFGGIVSHIPTAVLAGVLLGASWRIANPSSILENMRTTWPNRVSYLSTAAVVVSIDLIWGIIVGVLVHALSTGFSARRGS